MIVTNLNDLTYKQRRGVILIDFYKDDCGPCALMEPTVNAMAQEFPALTVAKINVDQFPQEAAARQVTAFPTLFIIENQRVVDRLVGRTPAARLREKLQAVIR